MANQESTDAELVAQILDGDPSAFDILAQRHYAGMLRLARGFVKIEATAEEVVQDAWVGILHGLPKFEGRSAVKTWMYRVVVNRSITRAKRDKRSLPFSAMTREGEETSAVDPSRFSGSGMWAQPPTAWDTNNPERIVQNQQALSALMEALESLPDRQEIVVRLRDIEGLSAEEVCNVLEISESNQRVLLHRGRSKLRAQLERVLAKGDDEC